MNHEAVELTERWPPIPLTALCSYAKPLRNHEGIFDGLPL
jgi:hypothetical protein